MATTPQITAAPRLGEQGEPCPRCGAPLASDQRYCLHCGARRAEARLPFMDVLSAPAPHQEEPPPPQPPPGAGVAGGGGLSPGTAAVGVGLAVLFLGVGVLVGKSGSDKAKTVAAPAPSVVTVGGGSGGTATTAQASAGAADFKSDWPDGKEGWTVELQALSKDGADSTQVATAKQAAQGKGAPDVGALDSDSFGSLTPNQYVIYSGQYKTQAEATAALGKVKKSFPKARVVHVAAAGGSAPVINSAKAKQDKRRLEQLQNLSGADYSKQSRKLPKTLALPGKAPPKDNKAAGGGSGFQTIG